jgi:hypothetical protein
LRVQELISRVVGEHEAAVQMADQILLFTEQRLRAMRQIVRDRLVGFNLRQRERDRIRRERRKPGQPGQAPVQTELPLSE